MRASGISRLACIALVCAALGSAGCGKAAPAETTTSSTQSTPTIDAGQPDLSDAERFSAWVRSEFAGAPWVSSLVRVVYATKLGSPVIELHLDGSQDEVRALAEQALGALRSQDVGLQAWVEVWDEEGQLAGAGFGTPRQREFPPSPEDVEELRAWLDAVYGPGSGTPPEPWYSSIETVELGESAARLPVVKVTTSLPVDERRSADQAALIVIAVSQASPSFVQGIEVWYADDMGLLSGSTDAYDPYVY